MPYRLVWVALVFVAAAPVFWRHVEIGPENIARAHENAALYQTVYPSFAYGFGRLAEGDVPLWNPNQGCGVPFLADPATGLFQPLNAVFLCLPAERALAAHAYVCLTLMGLFFVLFARALKVGYLPAVLGGMAYAFSGTAAAAMSRPALANTLVWMPFVFWGLHEYLRTRHLGYAGVTGLGSALLILSGSPALVVAILCLAIPYYLYLSLFHKAANTPRLSHRIAADGAVALAALILSAIQWMPALAWICSLNHPLRTLWRLDFAGFSPQHWQEAFVQLLMTQPDALPHIGYAGVISLLVLPAALFHRPARRDAFFFICLTPICFAMAGAPNLVLPFGFPHKAFAAPGLLGIAALVSLGTDRLLIPKSPHAPATWMPGLIAVLLGMGRWLF